MGRFNFAIPLPRKKRTNRRAVRIRLPEYFDWEHEAQTGNEYAAKRLGRSYEVRPDYMKDYLIKLSTCSGVDSTT